MNDKDFTKWLADRQARIERLSAEAKQALAEGDENAAIVLYTLTGSMHMYADERLAGLCKIFASKARDEVIRARDAV